jgi:CRP-like cAMP-binding protein
MSINGIFPIYKWDFKSESICADLPQEDLDSLMADRIEHSYKKGETIFKEGSLSAGIYFINSGKVKKFRVDGEGREQVIYVANEGELIGYHAIPSEDLFPDSCPRWKKALFLLYQNKISSKPWKDHLF